MPQYLAGSAAVEIVPSLKNFHSTIRRELKTLNPTVEIDVVPRITEATRELKEVTRPRTINADVKVDTSGLKQAQADLDAAEKQFRKMQESNAASASKSASAVEAAEARVQAAKDASSDATAKQGIAETKLAELRDNAKTKASALRTQELKLAQATRDSGKAAREAETATAALADARNGVRDVTIAVDADTAKARAEIQALTAKRDQLKIQVDADTSKANSALGRIKAAIASTRGSVTVDADTSRASGKLRSLKREATIVGVISIGAVGGAGLGVIGALPAALAAAAGTAAGLGVALNGVGDALGAYNDASKSAGSTAKATAQAQSQSARTIADAQRSVADAALNVARTSEDNARSRTQAAREVQKAEVSAARSVASAESNLVQTKRALTKAQADLTKAVQDATQAQEDLAFQARGAVLDEKQAVIDLAEAKAELDNARASGADGKALDQLTINYQRQILVLDQAREANKNLAAEQTRSQKVGIQGSDQVVSAREAEAEAASAVAAANRDVKQAQTEGAEQIKAAIEAQAEAQVQAGRSMQDAVAAQTQAQLQLSRALADAGDTGSTAMDKINDAMSQLSPNARKFVTAVQTLMPQLKAMGDAVQDAFFAGGAEGLTSFVTKILPTMQTGLVQVAAAMGGVLQNLGAFLSSSPMLELFAQLWSQIAQVVTATGPLITGLLGAFLQLANAAMPAILAIVNALAGLGPAIMTALGPLIASGVFQQALGSIAQLVTALVPIVGILLQVGTQVLSVLGPILAQALTSLQGPLKAVGDLLVAVAPFVGQLLEAFVALIPPLVSILVPIFKVLTAIITALMPVIQLVADLISGLAPIFESIAAAVTPLIAALVSGLVPVIRALMPVVLQLVQLLVDHFLGVIEILVPPLVQVAQILGEALVSALVAIAPLFPPLSQAFLAILEALAPILPLLADLAGQIITALVPILPVLIDLWMTLYTAFLPVIPPLIELAKDLFPLIISVITTLLPILVTIAGVLVNVLAWVLTTVVVPVLKIFIDIIDKVIDVVRFLWESAIKPSFDSIGEAATWLWEHALKPAFGFIGDATERVGQFFVKMGDTIGGIWAGIKKLVHGGIQGIVDIVYNNGIRALANTVIKYIPNVDPLPELKIPEFASGGVIRGPGTGTSDDVPIYASNGEYVMTADKTRKYFSTLEAMRAGRYATGGIVGSAPAKSPALVIAGTADVSGLTAIEESATAAVLALQRLADYIVRGMNPAFASMTNANAIATSTMVANAGVLVNSANTLTARYADLAAQLGFDWQLVAQAVSASVANQNAAFNNLNSGMANVRSSMQNTSDWAVSQWNRIRAAAADPIRWVIEQPMNAGLIAAWNKLNGDFALGKAVNPIPVGFATGGYVSGPGTGTSDSIRALLSNGEYVMPEDVTRKTRPFLEALRDKQPEALQAAGVRIPGFATGGLVDIHGQQTGAAIAAAINFAKAESGKPYIWGGVGPAGYDCSGFMSAITNVLRGEAPHKRLGVARSQPWPGFGTGLGSAFSTGFSQVHTAGTLAGVNVESGGSPSRVKYGIGAAGADSAQFGGHAFLPIVGGQFVSGGSGGAMMDPGAVAAQAFAQALTDAKSTAGRFPGNRSADFAGAIAAQAVTAVQGKASEALSAALAPTGTGGAGVEQWRGVVLQALTRVGQPTSLVDKVLRRMNQESGGNPRAINDWDINAKRGTPSKGLLQVIDPTFQANRDRGLPDDVWNPLSNIVASMNYALKRYGTLASAYDRAGGYSRGGVAPGSGTGDTVPAWLTPGERVLPPAVTRNFDRFVSRLSTADRLVAAAVQPGSVSGTTIEQHVHPAPGMDERAIAADASRRIAFGLR